MAMTLAMDREPEVARFIDTYKFDQDMATKRDRYGGGTSLPLNSDGYEDKQKALRDERHKDWLVQQDKPRILRNALYEEQRQAEQQKLEARRYAPQPRPAQPLGPQMDYNAASEQAKAEERKAYQDYMKAKEERYWALRGRPVTPPGGLNIGQYDRQVKEQAPQKKQEYKRMLDEQQKEHMFLRARQEPEMAVIDRNAQSSQFLANKPPPGPSYGRGRDEDEKRKHDSEVFQQQHSGKPAEIVKNPFYSSDDYEKFQKELKKKQEKEYSEFLSKEEEQRKFSRDSNLAPKTTYCSTFQPPSSPFRNVRQTPPSPVRLREHRSDQMSEVLTQEESRQPNIQRGFSNHEHWPTYTQTKSYAEENDHQPYGSENGYLYNEKPNDPLMANREHMQHKMTAPYPKASSAPLQTLSPPATPSKLSLPIGQYDEMRPFIVKQRNKEYNSVKEKLPPLKKTGITPRATQISLPVGQYDEERPLFEKQRNAEYNELLEKGKIGKYTFRSKVATPPSLQGLPIGQQHYDPMYRAMEHQRNKEYNEFLQKKYGGNKTFRSSRSLPEKPSQPRSSFYYGNELEHEEKRKMLDDERRNDYNQFMKEQEPPRSKSIEIPSDADSGLPIGQHHHEAWRKFLREQRNTEYNQLKETKKAEVRNRNWNFDETGVLELKGDDAVQLKKRELRAERREDYNQYISQKKHELRNPYDHYVYPTVAVAEKPIVDYMGAEVERRKHDLREERKKDYELFKKQQKVAHPGRRHEFVDSASGPYGGLFHGLGEHGNRSEDLNRERHREYNERLEQQYAGRDRPGGRPKWVQETLPNNTDRGRSPMKTQPPADQYQQMLNEKRREEANMRRYEDPEYQDRLAQGRDRGEAGQRYGY